MKDTGERLIAEGNHQTLTYGEHLARYRAVLGSVKDRVVLDIASGSGYGTNLLASMAKTVTGIDYSEEAIEYSKKLYKAKNLEYIQGNAEDIPLPDNSVEVVISLETIEHIKNPEKFIKEVKRVLVPGGQFIVSTPNDDEYIEGNEFHLHEFQLEELKTLIKKYFKNSEYYYQGSYFSAGVYSKDVFEKGGKYNEVSEKTFGQPVEKAIYFLASASDSELAVLSNTTVTADAWNTKDDLQRAEQKQKEITELSAALKYAQDKVTEHILSIKDIEKQRDVIRDELTSIKNTNTFKIFNKLKQLTRPSKTDKS